MPAVNMIRSLPLHRNKYEDAKNKSRVMTSPSMQSESKEESLSLPAKHGENKN